LICPVTYCLSTKTNGETTLIGATGVTPKYISSAAFDYRYGKLFWTVAPADEDTYLYEIKSNYRRCDFNNIKFEKLHDQAL